MQRLSPNKRALLIGINYLGTGYDLYGCWNDVIVFQNMLVKNGYSSITLMTDEIKNKNTALFPTRTNIINGLTNFIKSSKANDTLVVYFSGHGSNVKDTNADEKDGIDETICVLMDRNKITCIIDDELRKIFEGLHPNAKLRCFFDSCHSGTIMDLPFRLFLNKTITLEKESKPLDRNILCISGCHDNSYSAETVIEENGVDRPQGVLSYFLNQTLVEYKNKSIRWIDLLYLIQQKIKENGYEQVPQAGFCNVHTIIGICDI